MKPLSINGLVTASVTPMKPDGSIWDEAIARQVDYLVESDLKGIYVLGSTGEGMLLTDDERKYVAEKFVEAAKGRIPIFVQVGHNSWKASAELARHAQEIGADAISATSPGYFKPGNAEILLEGVQEVCEASSKTPFYYYHIPQLSGVSVDIFEFTKLANERLENFVGIKYSDGATLYQLQELQSIASDCEYLAGSDEAYLMSCAQGYKGAVGSTYGYGKPLYDQVRENVLAGNFEEAQKWQHRANTMITILFRECGRAGLKAMWDAIGLPMGASRNPIQTPTESQVEGLKEALKREGFYEWLREG